MPSLGPQRTVENLVKGHFKDPPSWKGNRKRGQKGQLRVRINISGNSVVGDATDKWPLKAFDRTRHGSGLFLVGGASCVQCSCHDPCVGAANTRKHKIKKGTGGMQADE
jgi:hypothetical protein